MTQSVVGSLTLGYRPLWNKMRELAAVQLFVEVVQGGAIDAVHLVEALLELSSMDTPQLLLSMHNRRLLSDMLAHAPAGDYWIEVRGEWLSEPDIAERVPLAHARGLKLVWLNQQLAEDGVSAACMRAWPAAHWPSTAWTTKARWRWSAGPTKRCCTRTATCPWHPTIAS